MNDNRRQKVAFTPKEKRAFKFHALVVAAIAVGLYLVAPKGTGQVVGVLFAMCLFPIPPLVIYIVRRRKAAT
jgi:hypothetical protein